MAPKPPLLEAGPLFHVSDSRLFRFFAPFGRTSIVLVILLPASDSDSPILAWPGLVAWLGFSACLLLTWLPGYPACWPCSALLCCAPLLWPHNHDLARLLALALTLALTLRLWGQQTAGKTARRSVFFFFLWFAAEVMRAGPWSLSPFTSPRCFFFYIIFFRFFLVFFTGNWKPVSCLTNLVVSQPKIKFLSSCPTWAGIFWLLLLLFLFVCNSGSHVFFYFYFFSWFFLAFCFSHKMLPLSLLEKRFIEKIFQKWDFIFIIFWLEN